MTQYTTADLERAATGPGGLFYGVYPALVTANYDPKRPGSVRVRLPILAADSNGSEVWARLAVPMAGNGRGTLFVPDVEDEVLVAFEAGDVRRPYIVGALWNGKDTPPALADTHNNVKAVVSRSGIRIVLDDSAGAVRLRLETPGGQVIVLDDGSGKVEVSDSQGSSIRLDAQGVTVTSPGKVTVTASHVKVGAGMVEVDAGMAKFNGVVQCDTLITNAVVSSSYTPGAGNIW